MQKKHICVYIRISSASQKLSSQTSEIKQWLKSFVTDKTIVWYQDIGTGTNMQRPAMQKMIQAISKNSIDTVICWRLDRLGRTAKGLVTLFDELLQRKVNLISIKDSLDLSTPAGRLMANVLASVAAFETEVRKERQLAGIAAAKAKGKRWGGSEKGRRLKVTDDHIEIVNKMKADGKSIASISRLTKLSRPTIYKIINAPNNK